MPQSSSRDLAAHAVVVAGLVFGGAFVFIAPRLEERADRQASLAAAQTEARAAAERTRLQTEASAMVEQLERFEHAIESRSSQASDEIALHRTYHDAANRFGLSIERFDPNPLRRASARRRGDKQSESLPEPDFASTVRVDATGTLDSVVEFVEFISSHAGFVRVKSLRVTPDAKHTAQGIRMSLETEHFSFTVPDPDSLASADDEQGGS
ncbi:MAG: hypothetical protein ABL309_05270 [Phycisphaerales bacterium]